MLLKPLIERFNEERRQVGGKPVFVEGSVVSSGEAQRKIAARPAPARGVVAGVVAVGPAAQLRGRPPVRAGREPVDRAHAAGDRDVGADGAGARLPAQADRVRRHPRRWRPSNAGWAQFGKPQYGKFKLVHTNPDFSTSGLSAVVAEYYAATGKKEGLTEKDISNAGARKKVQRHRAVDRPLRRHDAVHRRPDAQGRARATRRRSRWRR